MGNKGKSYHIYLVEVPTKLMYSRSFHVELREVESGFCKTQCHASTEKGIKDAFEKLKEQYPEATYDDIQFD